MLGKIKVKLCYSLGIVLSDLKKYVEAINCYE